MRISSKGRYGLKAMIDLAVFGEKHHVSLKSIAERENISEAYLEQLFAMLKKEELVKSVRGPFGGYCLGRPAQEIKAGDILRVLEGSLAPMKCQDENAVYCGDDCSCCVSKTVWDRLNRSINDAANSITLEQLAQDYRKLNGLEIDTEE